MTRTVLTQIRSFSVHSLQAIKRNFRNLKIFPNESNLDLQYKYYEYMNDNMTNRLVPGVL